MKLSIHTFGILWKTLFGFSYYKSMDNFIAFHLYNLIKIKTLISEEWFYIYISNRNHYFLLSRPPLLLCTISLHPFLFHTPCICTSTCSLRMQSTFQNDDRTNFSWFLQPKFLHVLFFNRNKWTNATTIFNAFHMLY